MKIETIKIGRKKFKMFADVVLFPNTPNEIVIDYIAEEKLNNEIEKFINNGEYHKVRQIDEMYGYYVPQIVADGNDEREIRESIESIYEN